ncbi:MAG: hypothetical protein ATN31_10405 [Candidatus Epulonipiscioides saccharophilum]|nr:MAG: hypothetical protein ATN31_10405 [Epulopiscium sp. AS2M-Bin001]
MSNRRVKVYEHIINIWKAELKPMSRKVYSLISMNPNEKFLSTLSATKLFDYWYEGIHEDYKFLIDEKLKHIEFDDDIEIVYPWTDICGNTRWIRTCARMYKKFENKSVFIGYQQVVPQIYMPEYEEYKAEYKINVLEGNVTLTMCTHEAFAPCTLNKTISYDEFLRSLFKNLLNDRDKENLKNWFADSAKIENVYQYGTRTIIYPKSINGVVRYIKVTIKATIINNNTVDEFIILAQDIDNSVRRRERSRFLVRLINNLEYMLGEEGKSLAEEDQSELLIREFHDALKNEDFEVYYQPKYNPIKHRIIGAEALIRWNFKKRKLISPDTFILLFEKNGYIIELDKYVWQKTCEFIHQNEIDLSISMNVSMKHLEYPGFKEYIESLVKEYQIDPSQLCLEFTETAQYDDINYVSDTLLDLQYNGLKLSLDDFGSGYSSLSLLKDLPVDEIKIDKSLVDSLSTSNDKAIYILETIAQMSNKLNVTTVVEGVETQEQLKLLRKIGFNTIQGYLFSKPLPAKDFLELLYKTNYNLKA